ncbi:aminopeptidase N [Leptospira sp. GIMC2001]|uniref:aminopeptidase N n=1 Tax=Leptospira sp. GIMC2001 TaxID=1513297 RepID=UPI00234AB157|nr:aminopeptidase N [Leptospira sp. GIMC2001]WCL49416.1 aminopeptidase N [Leptospira sp. GIMC2001]
MTKKCSFLILGLLITSCGFLQSNDTVEPDVLTQRAAQERYDQVQNVRYNIFLEIDAGKEFSGVTEILFDIKDTHKPLRVDFYEGKISKLIVNEKNIDQIPYEKGFLIISSNFLNPDANRIEIHFTHPYSRSGNGLHTFVDPVDNETYLYSQFETNHANHMFPCFDQPDLKATYKLDVIAPTKWKVISATLPEKSESLGAKTKTYFPETRRFSTYIFSLHAGPYSEWKDSYNNIPLRLLARKSMAQYVDHKLWFKATKQGLAFFEKYFDIKYPFSKYDQIIVPEFNFGAMENVGAVTFSERFLSRGKSTRQSREKTVSVILHEMAHMWFGNLVTMKWWDGLWLNESFATYMAAKAQYDATEFTESWETFFTGMKTWAYASDRSSTTHPIQGNVLNTEEAFTNFDGITYGKGASVLKQLVYFVGEENFRVGVSNYLKEFSYKNAELVDFLKSIESVSKKDLKKWSGDWLEKEGFNRVAYELKCSGGLIDSIALNQDFKTNTRYLRDHRMMIALVDIEEENAKIYKTIGLEYSDENTVHSFDRNEKTKCPDFVILNYKDYDFVRTVFPKEILEEKNHRILRILLKDSPDTLTSLMLWRSLYDEVLDGRLSISAYKDIAMSILPEEDNDIVLESNLGHITSNHFISYHSLQYLQRDPERSEALEELEKFTWEETLKASANSDRKRLWFRNYLSVGNTKTFFDRGHKILISKENIPGLTIDQDLRWSILKKLCSFNHDDHSVKKLLEAEKIRDKSRIGLDSALACEAAHPDPVTKGKWMAILTKNDEGYSASTLRTIMYYIFPIHQKNLQIPFVDFFYQNIKEKKVFGDENYLESYSSTLAPQFCTEENKHILKKFINNNQRLSAPVLKNLKQVLETEEDCLKVRNSIN